MLLWDMELDRLEDVNKLQTFTAEMGMKLQAFNSQTHATTYVQ